MSLMAVCPPNWTTAPSGFSISTMVSTSLRSQRFEIQFVSDIKVCADGLRVIVDDDGLKALFLEGPGAVNRTEVELDTLTNADRSGTENENLLLLSLALRSFSLPKQE